MSEFDIVPIKTLNGFVKIKCSFNDTIQDLIVKVLNGDYEPSYFGLQTEDDRQKNSRRFICNRLQWGYLRLILGPNQIYLSVRVYPLDLTTTLSESIMTVRYLKEQLCEQMNPMMSDQTNLEVALDLGCLIHYKHLKVIINDGKSGSSSDLKSLFPPVVIDKIKSKHLKKLIQPKIAEIERLSEMEYLRRTVSALQNVNNFDQDEFKCSLGAGEGLPVTVLVGPKIDICLSMGPENKKRVIGFFRKVDSIAVSITPDGQQCQVRLGMTHNAGAAATSATAENSLVLTFIDVEVADNFVHLLDAYTGHCKLVTSCPVIHSKSPPDAIDLPEIDKSRVKREKILDNGQFGDVYKGTLRQSNEDVAVAVKMCKAEVSDEDRRLFLAEAEVMRLLEHPHIVQLLGVSQAGEEWWIVMEFCQDGQLLSHLIDDGADPIAGCCSQQQLLTLCYQLASAMDHVHSRRIIHRDIAARNVLLAGPECAKLADFGKAVRLHDDEHTDEDDDESIVTVYVGDVSEKLPVRWAALESLAQRHFSFASDVWAFGVLIWEVLSRGRKPYTELSNSEVYPVLRDNKRLPRLPGLPESLHMLLLACWAADPLRRPGFSALKNKINEIKVEVKKMAADDRVVSLAAGLNRKPPIKPSFGGVASALSKASINSGGNGSSYNVNQSMPDLLHPSNSRMTLDYQLRNQNHNQYQQNQQAASHHLYNQHNTMLPEHRRANNGVSMIVGSGRSSSTMNPNSRATIANFNFNVDSMIDNFKIKTNNFINSIQATQSCSILQLKGFGLAIRHFLQELDRELPPHPVEHELTSEESVLIQLFKSLIRKRVGSQSSFPETMISQMTHVCQCILTQTDRIANGVDRFLQPMGLGDRTTSSFPTAGEYA